jgi:predicted alpha/beta-fold hydrolase
LITCSTSTCETIWEIDSALTAAFIGNQDVQEDGG